MFTVDYSIARPGGAAIRSIGAGGVVRYTGAWRNDGAIITADEYRDLVGHGLGVALVMEYAANWLAQGYAYGHAAMLAARDLEAGRGIPFGVTYAAADWDITLGGPPQSPAAVDNCRRALDTMHGMADAAGGWQYVRPYGSRFFCEWVKANSPITVGWSTQAWSNYVPANNAVLYQYAGWPSNVPFLGGCDYNAVLGDYAPRNGTPVPPPTPTPTPGGDILASLDTIDLNKSWDFRDPELRTVRGLLRAWGIKSGGVLADPDDTNSARMRDCVYQFQRLAKLKPDKVIGPATWKVLLLAVTH